MTGRLPDCSTAYDLLGFRLRVDADDLSYLRAFDELLGADARLSMEEKPDLFFSIETGKEIVIPGDAMKVNRFGPPWRTLFSHREDEYVTDGHSIVKISPLEGVCEVAADETLRHDARRLATLFVAPGLCEMLRAREVFYLHAGCVEMDGSGILIAGPQGCGKSTLSVSFVGAGARYLADDLVFLRRVGNRYEAKTFRLETKLDQNSMHRFSDVTDPSKIGSGKGIDGKWMIRVEDLFPGSTVDHVIPEVVFFPKIKGHERSSIQRLERKEMFFRLLDNCPIQHSRALAPPTADFYRDLSGALIGFEFFSGKDVLYDPDALREITLGITI